MNVENQRGFRSQAALETVTIFFAAFGVYFCMYGFRKPYTAAEYLDGDWAGLGWKTILVTAQTLGYLAAKFVGIRVIAELAHGKRIAMLFALVTCAHACLLLLAVIPRPWNAGAIFLNGLSLGMVFGLVQSFLEGRRTTELLSAGLCASFILADGFTKGTGKRLLDAGISEQWMPFAAGAAFWLPFAASAALLARSRPPSVRDIAERSERVAMSRSDRAAFLSRHAFGVLPIIVIYLCITIVRGIRSDFAPELWKSLGEASPPSAFVVSEIAVAACVLIVNGATSFIRDNRSALFAAFFTCGLGAILLAAAFLGREWGGVDAFTFMVLTGTGLYLPYVAVHTTIFERLIGLTRERANLGFLMYLADSIGYLGYFAVMLSRSFAKERIDALAILYATGWTAAAVSIVSLIVLARYAASIQPSYSECFEASKAP